MNNPYFEQINNLAKAATQAAPSFHEVLKAATQFSVAVSDLAKKLNDLMIEQKMRKNLKIKEYTLGLTILEKQRLYGN
jgi:hypothetical protein